MKTVKQDVERSYTGTNFVVITLIILVALSLMGWGVIQWREMLHTDETAVPGVMSPTPDSLQQAPSSTQPAHESQN